eukprot:2852592-Rhodomonas_salina.1
MVVGEAGSAAGQGDGGPGGDAAAPPRGAVAVHRHRPPSQLQAHPLRIDAAALRGAVVRDEEAASEEGGCRLLAHRQRPPRSACHAP